MCQLGPIQADIMSFARANRANEPSSIALTTALTANPLMKVASQLVTPIAQPLADGALPAPSGEAN